MNCPSEPSPSARDCRFLVGIDLGTTNSVVSYVDREAGRAVQGFPIPQLVAPGELGADRLLPSFCYLAAGPELPPGALALPWKPDATLAVGIFAREQGTAVPERMISSAKSWLAHGGVDRTRGILPWGSDLGPRKLSPVDVSFEYLEHIRQAWDHTFAGVRDRDGTPALLAEQEVILTVPASFDEVARELTVQAARRAGIEHLTLIEEPLAAFYAWLSRHEDSWQEHLRPGQTVLVIDVGGGTTDFSLVAVDEGPTLRRTAVGDHLLLGGDNMDMALARIAERAWDCRLPARQWFLLCQLCRRAKEALLTPGGPDTWTVTLGGTGSALVAGTRTYRFRRDELEPLILEGFFPVIGRDSPPPERRRGIQEMGLPYAADPAVTRHLLQFLRDAAPVCGAPAGTPVLPSAVLFSGGALLPPIIRRRLCTVIGEWHGVPPVPELEGVDLNLAVSHGAAYHGLVRRGEGVRVRGGLSRAYYLQVESGDRPGWLCVLPRDAQEGAVHHLAERRFQVRTNRPVRFPLAASATRLGDREGDVLTDPGDLVQLPALHTVLRYGRRNQDSLAVTVSAQLNEVGTLDLWLTSTATEHRYPLAFDLRAAPESGAPRRVALTVEEAALQAAEAVLRETFSGGSDPGGALRALENALCLPRQDWSLPVLRRLGDVLLSLAESRAATSRHEARWLNLTGFCLRPGFGAPGDEWRVGQVWRLWPQGTRFAQPQPAAEWWVLWRRVAAGLRSGQQEQIASRLLKALVPRPGERLPQGDRSAAQETVEKWRCLGALEALSPGVKTDVLTALLRTPSRLEEHHYWVIARLGARKLFHGPADRVVPAGAAAPLLRMLLERCRRERFPRAALFATASLARLCGIRDLDLPEADRQAADEALAEGNAPASWRALLASLEEAAEEVTTELVGDQLPLGLSLVASEP